LDSLSFALTAILTFALVITTLYYSRETKNEVAMASRPLLVIRAVVYEAATTYEANKVTAPKGAQHVDERALTSHFSHFELFNAGNSPAIDLEITLMDSNKGVLQGESLGFLRNNEQALTFVPNDLEVHQSYSLACEYGNIRSLGKKIWHQTWLPFTTVEGPAKGTINVNVAALEFKEVRATERIVHPRNKDKILLE